MPGIISAPLTVTLAAHAHRGLISYVVVRAHTYTCTFTACAYTSPCTRTFTCARTRAPARARDEHDRNFRRRSVCARTRPPGRPRIKMASFYVFCDELHDLPQRYAAGEKRSLDVCAHL